jgi:hypothetical protein
MSKRYAIFAGDVYYACGGIEDLVCVCNDLEKAKRIYDKLESKLNNRVCSGSDSGWLQLYDLFELKMIKSSGYEEDDRHIDISSDDDSSVEYPFNNNLFLNYYHMIYVLQ